MRRLAPPAIALVAAGVFTFRPTYDPDLFWHLAQGREVLSGHVVRTNLFSGPAADYPQHYTSWAFEAGAAASAGAGIGGVEVLEFALLAAALLMLHASARLRHSRTAALGVLLLSLFVIEPRAMPRPYLVSFLGLSACAYFIERWAMLRDLGFPRILLVLPVFLLWSNFHSEVVFGVGLIGLFGLCEFLLPSLVSRAQAVGVVGVSILALFATLATPYGTGLWRYLLENTLVPETLRIAELLPPSPRAYPAFFAYAAAMTLLLAVQPRLLRLWEIAVVVVFTWLGMSYIRFMPMLVFATAPIVAGRIDALIVRGWDRRAALATVAAVMVATAPATPLRMLSAWRTGADAVAPPDAFSAGAIGFVRAHQLSGPLFNSMNLGGWVTWMLPDARVFVDSRLQAYPPEHFAAILGASKSPAGWRALVTGVDWAMLSLARPNDMSGVGKFAPAEWAPVFRDRAVEILVRRTGRYADLARVLEISGK